MKLLFTMILLTVFACGCEHIPVKDGELAIGTNTTAGVAGVGVGKISNKF